MAASYNHFSADSFASPVAVEIHNQVISWLCSTVGYGDSAAGDITSGGTNATVEAFATVRHSRKINPKDYDRIVVYASNHTHHCYQKALDLIFGGSANVHLIPTKEFKLDPKALEEQIKRDFSAGLLPTMIIASAGTTNLES